ncbi:hypothetical protein [Halomontanus rarus]|uniref:hypothetical protein n=1 Tax=Halomontanus rarus TaxID=3034020 RepID=UPI001A994EF9
MGTQDTRLSVGRAAVAVALVLLVGRLAFDIAGVTPVSGPVWPLGVLAGFVLVVAFYVVSVRSTDVAGEGDGEAAGTGVDAEGDGDGTEDTAPNSVWNAIPPWQYGGRHAESGGLTRDEQEQALAEIRTQAAELERESDPGNQR